MKTKANNDFPEIDWEIGEMLEKDIDERMEVFLADGEDEEGNKYRGIAYYFCDEFDKIEDIESL